jgi:hypothetical protein
LEPYYQDFEGLVQDDPLALANDGWLVWGNVFLPDTTFLYGYGAEAPNHNLAFCQIVLGEGGPDQGEQVLVVFSDYENEDHDLGYLIESNVYQEQLIEAADIGSTWRFAFDAKRGNIELGSTAVAFIKTLDPSNNYELTNFITVDMTRIPYTWWGWVLTITIDETLENQLLQIGFANTATNYEPSAIFYDNLIFEPTDPADVPEPRPLAGAALQQNYPNPFHPTTRIDFFLDQMGPVDFGVFDPTGRRIATLHRGVLEAGEHHVNWNGLNSDGSPASSGLYFYSLKTTSGEVSGRMVLTD